MHSKVIFASIVCMLAASFGGAKPVKGNYAQAPKENESTTSCAPNIEYGYFDIDHNYGDVGETIVCAFYHEQGSNSDFHVIQTPGQPLISTHVLAPVAGPIYVYVPVPSTPGDTVIRFGRNGGSPGAEGKIYIHADGEHAVMSPYSAEDAKKQFFYRYVASRQDKTFLNLREGLPTYPFDDDFIIDLDPTFPIIPDPGKGKNFAGITPTNSSSYSGGIATKPDLEGLGIDLGDWLYQLGTQVDAIEHLNNYVYSDVADVVVSAQVALRGNNAIAMTSNTVLEVNANWIDECNQSHPLIGAGVDFLHFADKMTDSSLYYSLISHDPDHTNDNGACSISLTKAAGKSIKLKDVSMQLTAKNDAIDIKDCFDLNHPYLFRNSSNTLTFVNNPLGNPNVDTITLNNIASITYNVTVYPDRSDRAAAYLIAEGETIPYRYTKQFAQRLDPVPAYYPAEYTAYEDNKIKIQREDYNNFDILNHEYGHYICDELELCTIFKERKPHGIHDDLSLLYDEETARNLAFSEGLASYLAFASQNYYYDKYSNIDMIGDYLFFDRFRGGYCYCEFWSYAPSRSGSNPSPKGETTESATISILAKLMDDVFRSSDNVALGDQAIWDVLLDGGNYETIIDFVNCLIDAYPQKERDIRTLAYLEYIPLDIPTVRNPSDWTIMIYMCADSLAPGLDINEIKSAVGKMNNVNVIIETDYVDECVSSVSSEPHLYRYYLNNNHKFVLKEQLQRTNMGEESTFESFMRWGLTTYPANKTGVIIWNHGRALDGVCVDHFGMEENDEDTLLNSEAFMAFQKTINPSKGKLEFIGYDCCLMQVQDVAEFNSYFFNYMVASEEEEMSKYMWGYDTWLPILFNGGTTEEVLEGIVDSLVGRCEVGTFECWEQTLSVLDLSYMSQHLANVEALASEIANNQQLLSTFLDSLHGLYYYGMWSIGATPESWGVVDCSYLMNQLKINYSRDLEYEYITSTEYESVISKIDSVLSLFPNEDEIIKDDKGTSVRTNRLVKYLRATKRNKNGAYAESYGLSVHVCILNQQTYLKRETHFNNWRSLFVQD